MNGVSISDMHSFVENLDDNTFKISPNVGNIIELDGENLGDDLGLSLLSNTKRPVEAQTVSGLEPLGEITDIGVNSFEPLESISFDMPSTSNLPSISINKESDGSLFSNDQTASGPSISLAAPTRLSPEEERKKKGDLLNKLNRLQTKGYTLTKRFTMDNSLEEIQQEHDRLLDAKNLEASLRFQRQCLMGVATGAEFLNSKFNPFDWELDGWSESVHENIEDFDEVFEELYDKYKGRGSMPPEAKLMMSLVGSGFMFHMSNSFFRSKMSNMNPNDIFKNNPDLAKQFAAAAAQQAGPGFGNFMGAAMGVQPQQMPPQMPQQMPQQYAQQQMPQQMPQRPPQQMQTPGPFYQATQPAERREMKGPSGLDDILKTFQEVRSADMPMNSIPSPTHSFSNQPVKQAMSEIESLHSEQMSDMESQYTGSMGQRPSGRGRRKATVPVANTISLNL
jgi:Family of unknown function (DUF5767)